MISFEERSTFDDNKTKIITKAKEIINNLSEDQLKSLTDTQLRNLLNKSMSTDSIEEIVLYIEYQVGRKYNEWIGISDKVIPEIKTGLLSLNVWKKDELQLQVVQYFFGCLIRFVVYEKMLLRRQFRN